MPTTHLPLQVHGADNDVVLLKGEERRPEGLEPVLYKKWLTTVVVFDDLGHFRGEGSQIIVTKL